MHRSLIMARYYYRRIIQITLSIQFIIYILLYIIYLYYYINEKITSAEKRYISYKLEVRWTIIKSLKIFEIYLLDILFKIVIDCIYINDE
jgi:hypothetical protein